MLLVGLTGGIGCGKSLVGELWREAGLRVVDTDEVARRVVAPGTKGARRLREVFGPELFDAQTGQLDRAALAELVFRDAEARQKLNAITHPLIQREVVWEVVWAVLRWERVLVLEVPLLFETGLGAGVQWSVAVVCEEEEAVRRVVARDSVTADQARSRLAAQLPMAEKARRAHSVIRSDCTVPQLKQRANLLLRELRASRLPWLLRSLTLALYALAATLLYKLIF